MIKDASFWIQQLQLQPHPEGGFFRETYKSEKYLFKNESTQSKPSATLIYFLLKNNDISAFHKLKSDEVWMYHTGGTINIFIIDTVGQLKIEKFGNDIANGENIQVLIPANSWFSAELTNKNSFSLMSCMVTPGFEWSDFELGNKEELKQLFPIHKSLFEKFCIG